MHSNHFKRTSKLGGVHKNFKFNTDIHILTQILHVERDFRAVTTPPAVLEIKRNHKERLVAFFAT